MPICTILEKKLDNRKNGDDCEFNGYLEDYLNLGETDPVMLEALQEVLKLEPGTKICIGLKSEINKEAISNQIIRYKDVFKLEGKPLVYPYILYLTKEDEERALMILPDEEYGYLFAKGLYYCMTEPGSEFIECKNEIVSIAITETAKVTEVFSQLFTIKPGAIQRKLDKEHFKEYEQLKELAINASVAKVEEAKIKLASVPDRLPYIYQYVIDWFLLKKILYVQYMMNKNILAHVHEGNIRKQRNQAKLNAEEVRFLSFSEMWNIKPITQEES